MFQEEADVSERNVLKDFEAMAERDDQELHVVLQDRLGHFRLILPIQQLHKLVEDRFQDHQKHRIERMGRVGERFEVAEDALQRAELLRSTRLHFVHREQIQRGGVRQRLDFLRVALSQALQQRRLERFLVRCRLRRSEERRQLDVRLHIGDVLIQ